LSLILSCLRSQSTSLPCCLVILGQPLRKTRQVYWLLHLSRQSTLIPPHSLHVPVICKTGEEPNQVSPCIDHTAADSNMPSICPSIPFQHDTIPTGLQLKGGGCDRMRGGFCQVWHCGHGVDCHLVPVSFHVCHCYTSSFTRNVYCASTCRTLPALVLIPKRFSTLAMPCHPC